MKLSKLIALVAVSSALSACSGNAVRPTPLEKDFKPQVRLKTDWFRYLSDPDLKAPYQQLTPVVKNGLVYGLAADGHFRILKLENGDTAASGDLKETVSSSFSTDGQWFFTATDNGELLALDETFAEQWRVRVSSRLVSPPLVAGGKVFASAQDGRLQVFDRSTGVLLWQYDSGRPRLTVLGNSQPVVQGNQLIAAFDSGKLVSFDIESGKPMWEYTVAQGTGRTDLERLSDIDGPLLVADGVVIASAADGTTAFVDLSSGRPLQVLKEGSENGVAASGDRLFMVLQNDVVASVNPRTGEHYWDQNGLKFRHLGTPVLWQGYLAVVDRIGYLHLINPADGTLAARQQVDFYGVRSNPVVAGDQLLVQGVSGRIKAYSIENDKLTTSEENPS